MSDAAVSNSPNAGASSATRRSTRVFKKVSLNVSGRNRIGNTLLETTSMVAMNCHGCLYASRYEYQSGSWITLDVPSQPRDGKSRPVRAQVKFMRLPRSPQELYQVGVELETPANVWGVQSPPQDWLRFPSSLSAAAGGAAEVQGFMQEAANELRERFSAGLREIADRTGKEFDGETARVTDRQLARLAENAQATSSEAVGPRFESGLGHHLTYVFSALVFLSSRCGRRKRKETVK